MKLPDGTEISDEEYHWGAFVAALNEKDATEVSVALSGAIPCFPVDVIRNRINVLSLADMLREADQKEE